MAVVRGLPAGRIDSVAGADAIGRGRFVREDGERFHSRELRGVDAALVIEQHAVAGIGRSGLQMQAIAQVGFDDFIAEWTDELGKVRDPISIRPARTADVDAPADAQDITAVEEAARDSVQLKTTGKAGGGRPSLICPRGRTWPGDDGVIVEQERRILNEDGIGVIGKLGQPNDLEPRRPQRLFIIGVLARRP